MVLKANPKYCWGTAHKPATQNVVIRFLTDDNAAVNALKAVTSTLSPVNATLAKSLDASTYTVSAADGSDKFVLAFNCTNDKLKRQACPSGHSIRHQPQGDHRLT